MFNKSTGVFLLYSLLIWPICVCDRHGSPPSATRPTRARQTSIDGTPDNPDSVAPYGRETFATDTRSPVRWRNPYRVRW